MCRRTPMTWGLMSASNALGGAKFKATQPVPRNGSIHLPEVPGVQLMLCAINGTNFVLMPCDFSGGVPMRPTV